MLTKKKDPQNLSVRTTSKKKEVKQQYSKRHIMQKHVKFMLYQRLSNILLQRRIREKNAESLFRRKPAYDAKRSSILNIFAYQTNFQTGETISLTQKHLLRTKQNGNGERMMQKRICSL